MAVANRETPDVQSVARAAAVLHALGELDGTGAVRDLAAATRLPAPTVSRLLATLERAGLVERLADGRYALGLALVALAARVGPVERLRRAGADPLAALRDATGETASLLVRSGDEALYVDQAESPHVLRLAGWAGRRIPLATTAAGAALRGEPGPQSATDAVEPGVTAVACAIRGAALPAAVSVAGPSTRLSGLALASARTAVGTAAAAIEARLAAAPPSPTYRRNA